MGGFVHVLAYKLPKTQFFALKYLIRYTHETFFEEYMNFEAHYLSRCRDIPLQSFGSHIRPQPHGLELRLLMHLFCLNPCFLNKVASFISLSRAKHRQNHILVNGITKITQPFRFRWMITGKYLYLVCTKRS
jgi:hypothetical protein